MEGRGEREGKEREKKEEVQGLIPSFYPGHRRVCPRYRFLLILGAIAYMLICMH